MSEIKPLKLRPNTGGVDIVGGANLK